MYLLFKIALLFIFKDRVNDIITEEAGLRGIEVIDLRIVCAKPECYSDISSIEPSNHGAEQITLAVRDSFGLKAA